MKKYKQLFNIYKIYIYIHCILKYHNITFYIHKIIKIKLLLLKYVLIFIEL